MPPAILQLGTIVSLHASVLVQVAFPHEPLPTHMTTAQTSARIS